MKRAKKALLRSFLATELESVLMFVYISQVLCIEAWAVRLSRIAAETKTIHPSAAQGRKINQAWSCAAWTRLSFFLLPTRWYSGQWHSYCLQYSDLLFRFYLLRDPESGLNRTSSCVLFFSRRELSHVTTTVRASGECRDRQNSGSFWGWCSCCSKQKQVSDSKGSALVIAVKLFLPCMSFFGEASWFNFKKVQSLKALHFFVHNLISKFWYFFFWKAIHIC